MGFIFWWVIVGLIAGILGKFIMPGKDPGGFVVTILLGIAGALLAGKLGAIMGVYSAGGPNGFVASIVAGTIGAIALLALYRVVMHSRTR